MSEKNSTDKKEIQKPQPKRRLHNYGPYSSTYTSPVALWFEKWRMRVISIAILVICFVLMVVLYPILLLIATLIDLIRYNKLHGFVCCRIATFFLIYFTISLLGILGFFFIYLISLFTFPSHETWMKWNYFYQMIWGKYLFYKPCVKALGLHVDIEYPKDGIGNGPKIIFMRHASFADTLLPQGLFSQEFQMRYVVKKELLWDPALNVGGSRSPNFFLYREAGQGGIDVEIDAIRNLVRDMTPELPAMVSIWPEGTRFSEKKRAHVLESLKKKDMKAYEVASKLKYTLLPRLGGALALLESNPCADVLFCAHVGLEAAADFREVFNGKLCNSPVKVKFIRVKYTDIPKTKEERIEWMYQHWRDIDKWVGEHMEQRKREKKD